MGIAYPSRVRKCHDSRWMNEKKKRIKYKSTIKKIRELENTVDHNHKRQEMLLKYEEKEVKLYRLGIIDSYWKPIGESEKNY